MARVNKATEGCFSKIFGDEDSTPLFEKFINKAQPENPSNNLKKYLKTYKDYINKERLKMEQMSIVEELIMQLRSKENISDIKISVVRNYIYARCTFYRRDTTSKDVRVIVDNREFWKQSLKKLTENEEFMKKAKDKLVRQMNQKIEETINKLDEITARLESENEKNQKNVEKVEVYDREPSIAE